MQVDRVHERAAQEQINKAEAALQRYERLFVGRLMLNKPDYTTVRADVTRALLADPTRRAMVNNTVDMRSYATTHNTMINEKEKQDG